MHLPTTRQLELASRYLLADNFHCLRGTVFNKWIFKIKNPCIHCVYNLFYNFYLNPQFIFDHEKTCEFVSFSPLVAHVFPLELLKNCHLDLFYQ